MKYLFILLGLTMTSLAQSQILPNYGGQRAGLSALTFLKNDMNPVSAGMAGSSVAFPQGQLGANSNPASVSTLDEMGIGLSHMVIGAGIQQSFLQFSKPLKGDNAFAFTVNNLSSGAMKVRTEFQPDGTGQYFYAGNTAIGAFYGQQLNSNFHLGVGVHYIYEQFAQYVNHTAVVDIGFLYKTDVRDLVFAVAIQNFGGNSSLAGSFMPVDLNRNQVDLSNSISPTVFKMGFSLTAYEEGKNKITASGQLNNPNDNSENLRLGFAYDYTDLVQVYTGVRLGVKQQPFPTMGMGYKLRFKNKYFRIQYAVNPTQNMGVQHTFGITYKKQKVEERE